MSHIVEIKNVSVSYHGHQALKNISCAIPDHSFTAVIGPNGAGKSTFLTVINGLVKISSGQVSVCQQELIPSNAVKIRRNIGYVPQKLHIDPRAPMSVRDFVSIGRFGRAGLFHSLTSRDHQIIESALSWAGIADLAQRPAGCLSGGEQQKAAIACALAQEPKLILLDEPIAHLDPKAQREIIDLMDKIHNEQHITLIFVTHMLNHLPDTCDHAMLLKNGEILEAGQSDHILTESSLAGLYDCSVHKSGQGHFIYG